MKSLVSGGRGSEMLFSHRAGSVQGREAKENMTFPFLQETDTEIVSLRPCVSNIWTV